MLGTIVGRAFCLVVAASALGYAVNAARPDGVRIARFAPPTTCGAGEGVATTAPAVEVLTPDAASSLCGDAQTLLADVRRADDFAEGHVTGALHLPCAAIDGGLRNLDGFVRVSGPQPEPRQTLPGQFVFQFRQEFHGFGLVNGIQEGIAAHFGKRVCMIERQSCLGGAGVNTGTLPSKTLRETALYLSGFAQRGLYGVDYCVRREGISVPQFMVRKDSNIRLRTRPAPEDRALA